MRPAAPKTRNPIARKSKARKRRLAGCPIRGCKRSPYRRDSGGDLCKQHLVARLDATARARCFARYGDRCVNAHDGTDHSTIRQWAHIASRRHHAARWSDEGSVVLCARCHTFYTHAPDKWAMWCFAWFTQNGGDYEEFLGRALGPHPDLVAVFAEMGSPQ